ncbi:hypothetical protein FZI36_05005 [Cronobacter sakazakii]|nr:hypothetical protein FZI27_18420 [Cronobacter sakazakii]KAB2163507.1 hypothetical protein FZI34_16200 [Cronobacter sakazakii]KAB2172079.1 hypothetical protein FZI36_05005 [Cronobacter sakazakii]MCI0187703.1 hypothetical protein [Cronobacter sakazakii]MCI0235132.1 hypothetical protein [Cronobacter sakazakii]
MYETTRNVSNLPVRQKPNNHAVRPVGRSIFQSERIYPHIGHLTKMFRLQGMVLIIQININYSRITPPGNKSRYMFYPWQ